MVAGQGPGFLRPPAKLLGEGQGGVGYLLKDGYHGRTASSTRCADEDPPTHAARYSDGDVEGHHA